MYPYLIRIGGFSIPSYPVLYGAGITLVGAVSLVLAGREHLDRRKLAHLILIMAIAIMVGGRAFYVFQHWGDFGKRWDEVFDLTQGGQVFYGGMIFALGGLMVYTRLGHMPAWPTLDVISVGAPLGLALGRLGCFCRGCCFGKVSDLAWAVSFPRHMMPDGRVVGSPAFLRHVKVGSIMEPALESLAVHPSQLYSAAASLLVFVLMILLWRSRWLSGRLVFAYFAIYCATRFFLEFTRDNEMAFWNLTIPQVVSLVVLLATVMAIAVIGCFSAGSPRPLK